jgi:hypothetical protein
VKRALAALALGALALAAQSAERFSFAVFGDTPYFAHEEAGVARLLESLRDARVAFVVHVGDLKAGSTPCSDEVFADRLRLLELAPVPLVFVPGDNDWTDCHRAGAGSYDPLERLDRLRALFHAGETSLGDRSLRLTRQGEDGRFPAYPENARWLLGGIVFVTLNIPGSNNNLDRNPDMDVEHAERMRANFEWLEEAVKRAAAPGIRGLVVFSHADPRFGRGTPRIDGYRRLRAVLQGHAVRLLKPLLYVHGDGHRYRVDQPLRAPSTGRPMDAFTRVEVFGSPDLDWVRVEVDPANPRLFSVSPGATAPATP